MNDEVEIPRERSWREVRQSVNPRAMTPHGRRRLGWSIARMTTVVLLVGSLTALAAIWLTDGGFQAPAEKIAPVVKAEPLRDIVVLTDGVLDEAWVTAQLALPEGIALMAVDLEHVRRRLTAAGQVRSAIVSRRYPDTLLVTMEERIPVVRVRVPIEPRRPETFLVARDGVVYQGFHYDPRMLERLPWLDGVKLTRSEGELLPVDGMGRVAELLIAAHEEAPHLVRTWQVISLAEAPRLVVRTSTVREIVFEPANYRQQFARVDYLLDFYREQGVPRDGIPRLDVSLPSQVVVSFNPGHAPRRQRR